VLARQRLIGDARLAAYVGDLNAAGTHFAMILCLSLGLSIRERGRWRGVWMAASVACGVGLWLSASRTAEGAAGLLIPTVALWAATVGWPRTRRVRVIGGALGVLLLLGGLATWRIEQNPAYSELGFRRQFVMSSYRIIARHPYFGIGAGQYYNDSPLFLTPYLAWTYGSENAHNNFLQLATETGVIGFALFAAWFAGGFRLAISALLSSPRDWRLVGAAAGVAVFLATCLGGHPLLVPEVALAFYVQVALTACLGASSLLNIFSREPDARRPGGATRAAFRPAVALATLVLGVWPALTVVKPNTPVHQEGVDGFYYGQEADETGVPFRWTREYASVFIPGGAQRVELMLRAPAGTPADHPVRVEITTSGIAMPPTLVGDAWKTVTLELHPAQPPLVFNRVNLKSDPVSVLNGRPVGIRVSDVRFGRVAWEVVPAPDTTRRP
jgi:hypothetical protein